MDAAVSPPLSVSEFLSVPKRGSNANVGNTGEPAQTCRSFRRAGTQPTATAASSLYNPARHHAAASSIPATHHSSSTTRSTERTTHPDPELPQPAPSQLVQIHPAIPFLAARARTPMAVAGGGVALSLRVPSASAAPSMGRRRRTAVRCGATREKRPAAVGGGLEEDHYRTLRLAPGATRGEVKRAFHRLALQYHPDVVRQEDSVDFQRINAAYQTLMGNMREAEARLEYWRRRYGLADEDLDRYRHYLNDDDEDDWFADL